MWDLLINVKKELVKQVKFTGFEGEKPSLSFSFLHQAVLPQQKIMSVATGESQVASQQRIDAWKKGWQPGQADFGLAQSSCKI